MLVVKVGWLNRWSRAPGPLVTTDAVTVYQPTPLEAKGASRYGASLRFGGRPITGADSGLMAPQRGRVAVDDGGPSTIP